MAVAKYRIAGKFCFVDWCFDTVYEQVVDTVAGNSAPFKESWHQEVSIKSAQFCRNYISLDRVVSAQGRIRSTDY